MDCSISPPPLYILSHRNKISLSFRRFKNDIPFFWLALNFLNDSPTFTYIGIIQRKNSASVFQCKIFIPCCKFSSIQKNKIKDGWQTRP